MARLRMLWLMLGSLSVSGTPLSAQQISCWEILHDAATDEWLRPVEIGVALPHDSVFHHSSGFSREHLFRKVSWEAEARGLSDRSFVSGSQNEREAKWSEILAGLQIGDRLLLAAHPMVFRLQVRAIDTVEGRPEVVVRDEASHSVWRLKSGDLSRRGEFTQIFVQAGSPDWRREIHQILAVTPVDLPGLVCRPGDRNDDSSLVHFLAEARVLGFERVHLGADACRELGNLAPGDEVLFRDLGGVTRRLLKSGASYGISRFESWDHAQFTPSFRGAYDTLRLRAEDLCQHLQANTLHIRRGAFAPTVLSSSLSSKDVDAEMDRRWNTLSEANAAAVSYIEVPASGGRFREVQGILQAGAIASMDGQRADLRLLTQFYRSELADEGIGRVDVILKTPPNTKTPFRISTYEHQSAVDREIVFVESGGTQRVELEVASRDEGWNVFREICRSAYGESLHSRGVFLPVHIDHRANFSIWREKGRLQSYSGVFSGKLEASASGFSLTVEGERSGWADLWSGLGWGNRLRSP